MIGPGFATDTPMPRYYFDLHAGSLSEWDDEGHDANDADEAVGLAKNMLPVAFANNDRLPNDRHVVIMIRDRAGNQIATVTLAGSGETRVAGRIQSPT